ncbi:hypothetical protein GGR92_001214 [Spirosoma lacussanchae]|uniref:hypothetical protein n=1 Tax=Spirosoma lacussanchae TaxID=1884249 RepID=UPI001108813D|nr:hypothetical protein [Spirosoma lacussanchae]
MNNDDKFLFVTSQDEYHCILEKILMRAVDLYKDEHTIKENLINSYILMEKAAIKENLIEASFHYIKQLEEIVLYGINTIHISKIHDDLVEKSGEITMLSAFGRKVLEYSNHKNKDTIEKALTGQVLSVIDFKWRDKLKIYRQYFNATGANWKTDELLYYKRNHYGHANPIKKDDTESDFEREIPSCFVLLSKAQKNLGRYYEGLFKHQNR